MKRKMVFMMNIPQHYADQIRAMAPDWELIYSKESSVWEPHLKDAEILMNWNEQAYKACLNDESKLRWIHTWAAGVDDLPHEEFKRKDIKLTNSSGVNVFPVSETIFAMILSYTRHLHVYIRNQVQHEWKRGNNMLEMHGKTIGIIGVGAIGVETAKLAKAFGMKVLGLRRSGKPMPEVDQMFDYQGLETLLNQSDYVVLALPLTKETHHLMGEEQFKAMKSSAFFVNISRGATTDTNALIKALQEQQIAGAGIDVFEQEPLSQDSPLWEMENVIMTPHTAGFTKNYTDRVMDIFIPNLKSYLNSGEPNVNVVDLDRQY